MPINIVDNFDLKAKIPLDLRYTANTYMDVSAYWYPGMQVYQYTDQQIWYADNSLNWSSLNDVVDAYSLFLPNASIGTSLFWNAEYLDVSFGSIDSSIFDIWTKIGFIDASLVAIDSSIFDIWTKIGFIDASLVAIDSSIFDIWSQLNQLDASIIRIDASLNDVVDAYSLFLPNASLGTGLVWNAGYLDVSTAGGGGVSQTVFDSSIASIESSINALYTIVLDTSTTKIGDQTVDGSWRLTIDTSGNLSVQKRVSGIWIEKGSFI
jgi:hypothetical protein